jgi:hypothetical protein
LASTLVTAPPAAADCVSSTAENNPVTLCTQGEPRVSNRTPLPKTTPYVPYPCDLDWSCDDGLSIALGD